MPVKSNLPGLYICLIYLKKKGLKTWFSSAGRKVRSRGMNSEWEGRCLLDGFLFPSSSGPGRAKKKKKVR